MKLKYFALATLFLLGVGAPGAVFAQMASVSVDDPSPDGRHAVLLKRGPEMMTYEKVAIVKEPGREVVQIVANADDHIEDVTGKWAPNGRRLALYCGAMSAGATIVWDQLDDGKFKALHLPEIDPPFTADMKKPANEWMNDHVRPDKWETDNKLLLRLTGRISYDMGKPKEKVYDYEYLATIVLDRGEATIESIKEVKKVQVPRY